MAEKLPTHRIYVVEELPDSSEKKPFWNSVGAAWAHGDGKGYNIILSSLPIGGKLVMREITEKENEPAPAPLHKRR